MHIVEPVAAECLKQEISCPHLSLAAGDTHPDIIGQDQEILPRFRIVLDVLEEVLFDHGDVIVFTNTST